MSSADSRWPADPVLRARDERLDSLKAVAGKLAHDFNNFLAPQYGYLTMLQDEAAPGSTVATYLAAMGTAAKKAEGYVNSILLGMRPYRQFSPREFALNGLLDELLDKWVAEIPAGKALRVKREMESCLFCGDDKQWRTALEQLLANARYALALGGELEVTLRRMQVSGQEVQRLGLTTDELFCLRLRDTGFGMSPEAAARAFEPFFTTRTQIKAPGLGLTIVHGVTLLHGGQIELESVEDGGTTVTLWLPTQPVRPNYKGLSGPGNTKVVRKVLLIEDDLLIKELLRTWIVRHDLEVESATNEAEARRSLERAGSECVLVVCETDLHSGRGEDLYHKLGSAYPAPAWVLLSGARPPEFLSGEGRETPPVIQKPFSHGAFSELLRKYATPESA